MPSRLLIASLHDGEGEPQRELLRAAEISCFNGSFHRFRCFLAKECDVIRALGSRRSLRKKRWCCRIQLREFEEVRRRGSVQSIIKFDEHHLAFQDLRRKVAVSGSRLKRRRNDRVDAVSLPCAARASGSISRVFQLCAVKWLAPLHQASTVVLLVPGCNRAYQSLRGS